eukprot:6181803-Pleurochrysis_carterae.AAC.1
MPVFAATGATATAALSVVATRKGAGQASNALSGRVRATVEERSTFDSPSLVSGRHTADCLLAIITEWRPAPLPCGAARSGTARRQNGPGSMTASASDARDIWS